MAKRPSRGRQTIPIKQIQNQDDLYATFTKRRLGLYKKASELSVQCNIDIGTIIFSPTNNPYSFFSPNMEHVMDRCRNPNAPCGDYARAMDTHTYGLINSLVGRLNEVSDQHDELVDHVKELKDDDLTRHKFGWEGIDIEEMDRERVSQMAVYFEYILTKIRLKQLENGDGPSNQGNVDP